MTKTSDSRANHSVNAHRALLADPDVQKWYDEMAMGNKVRAEDYLRRLHRYCRAVGRTPTQLAAKAQDPDGGRRAVEDRFLDFAGLLKRSHKPADHAQPLDVRGVDPQLCAQGHPASYANNYRKALASWMARHDVVLRRMNLGDTDAAPTLEGVPFLTKDHVRTALRATDERGKVVFAFRAWTGVRPEVLGNDDASDGLVLRHLPELRVRGKTVTFDRMPTQVLVPPKLSKIRRAELKFLPSEGCRYLKAYLEWRAANGEDLGPDSPVVRSDRYTTRRFLETKRISGIVRSALRAIGLPNRPYDLRNTFIAGLEAAEHDGKIGHTNKEFFIGRKREIDLRYTHFRAMPPDAAERLRAEYKACEPYLGARPTAEIAAVSELTEDQAKMIAKAMLEEDRARLAEYGLKESPAPAWAIPEEIRRLKAEVQELRAKLEGPGASS